MVFILPSMPEYIIQGWWLPLAGFVVGWVACWVRSESKRGW